jgi:glycosyltransferase involved in cell wall biosynthesis
VISDTCADFRRDTCLWQKDKVLTVVNGVDIGKFGPVETDEKRRLRSKYGLDPDSIVVGAVGRLVKVKQFDLFIRAAALFKNKNILFILVGSGPRERELKDLAKELNLGNIRFIEWLNDVSEIYKCMDVYVMTSSFSEGFGLVTAEAMASALPIVAVKNPNHLKVITPECGIFVESAPSDIADGIDHLLHDEDLARQLSARARQRAVKEFDIDRAAKELEDLYLQAVGRKRKKDAYEG